MQDTRYTLRVLRRQPTFALLVSATLAVGMTAAIAIFTLCDRVLLRPLPYPHSDQIVSIASAGFSIANGHPVVSRDLAALPEFQALGFYSAGGLNLGDGAVPARVRAGGVTAGFFSGLDVRPIRGRVFDAAEEIAAAPVVVISDGLWRGRFASDDNVIGRAVRINGRPFSVIGVMPSGFTFPDDAEVWVPAFAESQMYGSAVAPRVIARLAPGVTVPQAVAAIARMNRARVANQPGRSPSEADVVPLQDRLVGGVRPTLWFLAAIAGLLLLVTCANVAGLLLSRLRVRERELLVRSALGASRGRLARQLVTECATITVFGAFAGIAGGIAALRLITTAVPDLLVNVDLHLDVRFVMVSLAIVSLCGVLFSLAPSFAAGRWQLSSRLREGATNTGRIGWLRRALVAGQMATALVLLTATSAAIAVVIRLAEVPVGFDNDHAAIVELTLPRARYGTSDAIVRVSTEIERAVRAIPGVTTAGLASAAPASHSMGLGVPLVAEHATLDLSNTDNAYATLIAVTPGYFSATGIRLIAGRRFNDSDETTNSTAVVLSEGAARELWPSAAAAVGQHLQSKVLKTPQLYQVVGVVSDVRLWSVTSDSESQFYVPFATAPPYGGLTIALAGSGDPAALFGLVQPRLDAIDPDLPTYNRTLVSDIRTRFMARQRLTLALASAFGIVALALCGIGVFGVLAQLVTQRTRELGIRMALGANPSRLRRQVIGAGLRLTLAGLAIGALASGAAEQLIRHFVPSLDPPSAIAIAIDAGVLIAISLVAAWIPSLRASKIDPLRALRTE